MLFRSTTHFRSQRSCSGGRGAGAGHDFLFDDRELPGDGGGGAEPLEECVADLRPQRSASLLGAAA
jgi:hypothetical protein